MNFFIRLEFGPSRRKIRWHLAGRGGRNVTRKYDRKFQLVAGSKIVGPTGY